MTLEFNGKQIETTETGFLVEQQDWSEALASHLAELEDITLNERHWDVIGYLRTEFFDNNGEQPNNRKLIKAMQEKWPDEKVNSGTLYTLFPRDPSKQGGRLAGLPESRRKGGY